MAVTVVFTTFRKGYFYGITLGNIAL